MFLEIQFQHHQQMFDSLCFIHCIALNRHVILAQLSSGLCWTFAAQQVLLAEVYTPAEGYTYAIDRAIGQVRRLCFLISIAMCPANAPDGHDSYLVTFWRARARKTTRHRE